MRQNPVGKSYRRQDEVEKGKERKRKEKKGKIKLNVKLKKLRNMKKVNWKGYIFIINKYPSSPIP